MYNAIPPRLGCSGSRGILANFYMDNIRTDIAVGDIVQHFKRETLSNPGNLYLYKILAFAEHTETKEMLVIYQALYKDPSKNIDYTIFARPMDMFMSEVEYDKYPDIKQRYRFEKYDGEYTSDDNIKSNVYVVKYYDIYDHDHTEFILGVASTYEKAIEIIKDEIKNIASCYHSYRFSIEQWELDKRYMGGLTESFTKEENIEFAKELGVYQEG